MSPRAKEAIQTWSGVTALVLALVSLLAGAASVGRRDASIDQKLDRTEYQKDQTTLATQLGELRADVRVIRTLVEERAHPRQAGTPR